MSTDATQSNDTQEDSVEFGCWKWIFVGMIVVVAAAVGFLVLV